MCIYLGANNSPSSSTCECYTLIQLPRALRQTMSTGASFGEVHCVSTVAMREFALQLYGVNCWQLNPDPSVFVASPEVKWPSSRRYVVKHAQRHMHATLAARRAAPRGSAVHDSDPISEVEGNGTDALGCSIAACVRAMYRGWRKPASAHSPQLRRPMIDVYYRYVDVVAFPGPRSDGAEGETRCRWPLRLPLLEDLDVPRTPKSCS